MATGSNKYESKTMATSNVCDGCETNTAVKYCPECNERFCSTCARSHLKVKYFMNHTFNDLPNADVDNSGEPVGFANCGIHEDKSLEFLCKECCVLICVACKPVHDGHTFRDLVSNPQICQRLCSKQIQQLLDNLHEIEDIKGILEAQIDGYGDAITEVDKWEADLLEKVKDKALRLREKLRALKDKRCKHLADALAELTVKIKVIDNKITELNGIRNLDDSETLSHQLALAQILISKLESYKEELKPLPTPLKMYDILPNAFKMTDVESDLDDLFSFGQSPVDGLPKWGSNVLIKDIEILNPDTTVGQGYRLCTSYSTSNPDPILLHGTCTKDIRIYDFDRDTIERKTADVKIWNMTSTAKGEYVAIDAENRKTIYLLDKEFKCKDAKNASHGGDIRAVCGIFPHRVYVLEMKTSKSSTLHMYITTLVIKHGCMITEKSVQLQIDDRFILHMVIHTNSQYVSLFSHTFSYMVDLNSAKFSKNDISQYTDKARIWSCAIDSADNTVIGGEAGKIHLIDPAFKNKALMEIGGKARGMCVKYDKLCITTTKNRLLIYK